MRLVPLFPVLASLFISLIGFPLKQVSGATAYDIVCEFKYQIGDNPWVWAESSGTTLMKARKSRKRDIEYLKKKANEAGLSFQAVSLFCEDPWGGDWDRLGD
ncbi:MAG: hypothetical protein WBA77_01910 [Microcoleaceae cyanobacterium]